ncbi:MAG: hypothetical protein KA152_05490 [Verrucomicrobiales bacterium]|nr:hypothetical protein [Verrucomicrobiales bacterium]HQW28648.1 hypothetical protein [Verrucomicrobiales bacterium]
MILWGYKDLALLDIWTIEHIVSGASISGFLKYYSDKFLENDRNRRIVFFTALMLLAYLWESVEHYLETGMAGNAVALWFYGVEHWSNRLLSDPAMLLIGCLFVLQFPILKWPARIFSISWLFIHIFVFPHSMYLHDIFSKRV